MTKRNNIFNENASKKIKLEETNIDDLWGEDLNPEDIEDCLLLATQACEQNNPGPIQRNNVSILPNYSFFKNNDIFTSTQNNKSTTLQNNKPTTLQNNKPTTSNTNVNKSPSDAEINTEELQIKIKKLETDFIAKEGEITMLRSQLKQIRLNLNVEHQKKEKEWTEKLQIMSKELISTKNELDFKNLEVVNLKHKITEVTKFNNEITLNGNLNTSQFKEKNIEDVLKLNFSEVVLDYPLKNKIDSSVFNLSNFERFYTCTLSLNKLNQKNEEISERYEASAEYNGFKFEDMFPSISMLINCNVIELNGDCNKRVIDKILFGTIDLIKSFLKNLNILKDNIQEETVRERDRIYLELKMSPIYTNSSIFSNEEWCKNEIGIKCRRIIAVLSEILPYSSHLRKTIFKRSLKDDDFFSLIKSAIKIIGILRISEICTGFLCSVVLFMTKTTYTLEFNELYLSIIEIIKEIIFTRPLMKTLEYICDFLKESSLQDDFVKNLCKKTSQSNYSSSMNGDKVVLCYNEESCLLSIFAMMFKERFSENQKYDNKSLLGFLQFLKQIFNYNVKWMYYNTDNECNCLRKIVEIGIRIIHKITKCFVFEINQPIKNSDNLKDYKVILKFSINLLHIIKFRCLDVFNKLSICSKYKSILQNLLDNSNELQLNDQEGNILKELNQREDNKRLNETVLNKIPIWL